MRLGPCSLLPTVVAALILAAGCRESAAGPSEIRATAELVGAWTSPRNALAPQTSHQTTLTFTIDGRFILESRTWGLYEGQSPGTLSTITRTEGRYLVRGDRIELDPQRLRWWDSLDGPESPSRFEESEARGPMFEDARFTVNEDRLSIRYTIAPRDTPIGLRGVYVRIR